MMPEYYRQMADVQEKHWWFSARRLIIGSVIETLNISQQSNILEIGCGPGANLQLLDKYGTLCATEMDSYALEYARQLFHGDLRQGWLPDHIPFLGEKYFDFICLFDVLEHVEDDMAALRTVYSLLKPGGKVFITVPAYQWLYGAHDRVNHHFRRYTARQIRRIATAGGFIISRSGYFNTVLLPVAVAKRLFNKFIQQENVDELKIPSKNLNALLYHAFALEANIIKHVGLPCGLSAFAILTKPS